MLKFAPERLASSRCTGCWSPRPIGGLDSSVGGLAVAGRCSALLPSALVRAPRSGPPNCARSGRRWSTTCPPEFARGCPFPRRSPPSAPAVPSRSGNRSGVRRRLPGDRQVRRVARPAEATAGASHRRPGVRVAATGPRGRRHRPRPTAQHTVRFPPRRRPHPDRTARPPVVERQRRPARRRRALAGAAVSGYPPETLAAYDSPTGLIVLVSGAALSVVAYRVMVRIGRLPDEQRVLV